MSDGDTNDIPKAAKELITRLYYDCMKSKKNQTTKTNGMLINLLSVSCLLKAIKPTCIGRGGILLLYSLVLLTTWSSIERTIGLIDGLGTHQYSTCDSIFFSLFVCLEWNPPSTCTMCGGGCWNWMKTNPPRKYLFRITTIPAMTKIIIISFFLIVLLGSIFTADSSQLYCPFQFDGYACWPATPAGSISVQPCPAFVTGFDPKLYAHKK